MTVGGIIRVEAGKPINDANQQFTFAIFKVAVLSAIGGFLFGYDTGIVSGAMIFIKDDLKLNHIWQEIVISVTIAAAWIFSMISGHYTDKYGRKKVIFVASAIFVIGSILMGIAWDKWSLMAGRLIVGMAIGFASMVVPMYIAEMAPARHRGRLVTVNNIFICGGQAAASFVAGGLSYLEEHIAWRLMLGLAAIPALIQFIGFLLMPESPRWLVKQGRYGEAKTVLQKIRGPMADVTEEYLLMVQDAKQESDSGSGYFCILKATLRDKYLRKALILGCVLLSVQQLTGINTVMYYSATIIQMSGVYDKTTAVWLASITASINFVCTFIGVYFVERAGRRPVTLISLAGVIASLILLMAGFQIGSNSAPEIGFRSDDSVDNICSRLADCNACIQLPECGFCFDESTSAFNGTCLRVSDLDDPTIGSTGGQCSNGTRPHDMTIWAPDWCPSRYSWLTLLGLCLYLFAFAPGMGAMPWTINAEIYPMHARSVCLSTATGFCWFFNLLVSFTFLSLAHLLTKQGAFALYGAFGVAGFIYLWFTLPETNGKSLEEMASVFGGQSSISSSNNNNNTDESCSSSSSPNDYCKTRV